MACISKTILCQHADGHVILYILHIWCETWNFWCKKMNVFKQHSLLETVQDFFNKLDIKPLMHLLEISIFSLNNDLVRLTKIKNNLVKDLKILIFKVIFQCLKLVESFQKKFCEEYLIRRPTYINEIFWKLWFLKYFIY